ncbi:hypothetical protein DPEC_G00170960 [Dallia pectoralis]|uniref:Uncharacterized protein n=1 Tax=Dallia pectoralis TaxID=75939 RepID=A0ACC2GDH1_DALPE|nr:hypothetical protein DPEC_G00170960 [Dallia pectoralis]
MDVTYSSQSICVLMGSTVELSCTYKYPSGHNVTETFWFTKKYANENYVNLLNDPDYSGRVTYRNHDKNRHTLTITDLRETDLVEYKFRFITDQPGGKWTGQPGVTLSVTGYQVEVTGEDMMTLTCVTSCTLPGNPTYIWYKNGQHVDESSSPKYKDSASIYNRDSYSCGVKGHEDLHSPSVCVSGQNCNRVIYTKRRICALKGSSVDISCTYNGYYPVTSSLWFSPKQSGRWKDTLIPEDLNTDPEYAGRVEYPDQESRRYRGPSTLRITDLREEDSAEYKFRFTTSDIQWGYSLPGTTLTVTGFRVDVSPKEWSNSMTLTCVTSCPLTGNPTYIWYKNGQHVDESSSPQYKDSVSSNYRDSYSCGVKGHEDLHSPTVCVYGQDCSRVIYTKRRICALKGSSVDISCTYNGYYPVTSSLWFSPKQSGRWKDTLIPEDLITDPEYAGRVEYPDQESRRYRGPSTLRITDLREEDSAEYKFRFTTSDIQWGYSLPGTTVTVTDLQVQMTPATVTEGQSVTLTCITSCTLTGNPTYIWYKKNVTSPKASGQSYSITNIRSEDSGQYYCEVQNDIFTMSSTAVKILVAGKQTSVLTASVGIRVAVLVLIFCLSGFIWFRKWGCKSPSDTTNQTDDGQRDSSPVYDNISDMVMTSTAAQTTDTDNQDDLQ